MLLISKPVYFFCVVSLPKASVAFAATLRRRSSRRRSTLSEKARSSARQIPTLAVLRRALASHIGAKTVHQIGALRIDLRRAEVFRDGQKVPLSAREFELLQYFVEHTGALLTREELLRDVWGYKASTSTRTVDVHVGWLRQKLEDDPKHPKLIVTSIGMGYRFTG